MDPEVASLEPFEIASIRPPTENQSLAFRMNRNCYWNRCAFCPVYKFTFRFSRRPVDEVREDIRRAARINRLLEPSGFAGALGAGPDYKSLYKRALQLIHQLPPPTLEEAGQSAKAALDPAVAEDPVLSWFLQWINESPSVVDNINHLLSWRLAGGETCFLGDADGLIVRPDFFAAVAREIRGLFPTINRFTIYGRTATAARRKSAEELAAFSSAGLDRVHFGLESGCDEVLEFVRKGETRQDHLNGCLKTKDAGISCSVYVMPGLGGKQWSAAHARDTAALLSEIAPDYIRLRTLEIFPQTPLAKARDRGAFTELEEEEVVREIKSLVDNIDAEAMLLSDSAANLLDVSGRLPQDREKMRDTMESYLALSERERALFSLRARIRAFEGQYGGLTEELHQELSAWVKDGALDVSKIPTDEARAVTKRIRARLMP